MRPAVAVLAILLVPVLAAAAVPAASPSPDAAVTSSGDPAVPGPAADGINDAGGVPPSDSANRTGPTAKPGALAVRAPVEEVRFLTLAAEQRGGITSQGVDVGAALGVDRETAALRLEQGATAARVAQSGDEYLVLDRAIGKLADRIRATRAGAQDVRESYVDGAISTEGYVRDHARRAATREAVLDQVDALAALAAEREFTDLTERLDRLRRELLGRDGPVRRATLRALRGTGEPIRLYAAASASGSVLATIQDGQYLRSTFREDLRSFRPASFSGDAAWTRAEELYPTAFASDIVQSRSIRQDVGNSWTVRSELPFGSIRSMIDSRTRLVFSELQRRSLSATTRSLIANSTENGTRLLVNASYPGGPLRITTIDNDTGRPTPTTVSVGSANVETGDDGVLWTLAPSGPSVQVRAKGPRGNVSVTVELPEPPSIEG